MAYSAPFESKIGPLLVLLLWAILAKAVADEPVLARIEALNGDRMTLIVQSPAPGTPDRISLSLADSGLGERARPGLLVRIWPDEEHAGGGDRTRLTPVHAGRSGQDPTGVRSRLTRGSGAGARRHAGGRRSGR